MFVSRFSYSWAGVSGLGGFFGLNGFWYMVFGGGSFWVVGFNY